MISDRSTFTETEVEASCRHWVSFFIDVCNRVGFSFADVKPDPLRLMQQVASGQIPLHMLEAHGDTWSDKLKSSPSYFDLNKVELLPARVAVMMASIKSKHGSSVEQTKVDLEYLGEWLDLAMERLGYDSKAYDDIWDRYFSDWVSKYFNGSRLSLS